MGKRIQSSSSINTYKQCPRKYYYQYIAKLATATNVHLIRGSIAHEVLEEFFQLNVDELTRETCETTLKTRMQELIAKYWRLNQTAFVEIGLSDEKTMGYFSETVMMLLNFAEQFTKKLLKSKEDIRASFLKHKPILTETRYFSDEHYVQGFIDAIHNVDGQITLMDYKTSKNSDVKEEYRLQLGIYAMLFQEKHGVLPDRMGLWFLVDTEKFIPVNDALVTYAKQEIELIHLNTQTEDIRDYPKKVSPLCKWSTGQCDFYDVCFGQKTIEEFAKKKSPDIQVFE